MLRIRIRTEEKALLDYTIIKTFWNGRFGKSENEKFGKNVIENDYRLCYSQINNENDYHEQLEEGAKP
jgi:hypothetical protein